MLGREHELAVDAQFPVTASQLRLLLPAAPVGDPPDEAIVTAEPTHAELDTEP